MTPKNTICLWYDKDAEAAARFYAATFPDSRVTGVGLGLATVRAIVRAHGGEVDLVSRPNGGGSCFKLQLPRLAT